MDSEFDLQQEFRQAMRRLAGTVSVVALDSGGQRHGTTATSVTSISMDPPSLLVCFNRESRLHAYLKLAKRFCVNLLHTDNCEVSKIFSSPLSAAARFAAGDWRQHLGVPYLADAQANLFCNKDREIEYGTHTIFVGRVTRVFTRQEVAPLLYRDGAYAAAVDLAGDVRSPQ